MPPIEFLLELPSGGRRVDAFHVVVPAAAQHRMAELERAAAGVEVMATIVGGYSDDNRTACCASLCWPLFGHAFGVHQTQEHVEIVCRGLADVWRESNGTQYFLGEWHSHHRGPTEASKTDLETAESRTELAEVHQHIMLISGRSGLGCWIAVRSRGVHRARRAS